MCSPQFKETHANSLQILHKSLHGKSRNSKFRLTILTTYTQALDMDAACSWTPHISKSHTHAERREREQRNI